MLGVFGILAHRAGEFFQRRRSFFEARRLFLGALRQIGSGAGDFGRSVGDIVRRSDDLDNGRAHTLRHAGDGGGDLADLIALVGGGDRDVEIAARDLVDAPAILTTGAVMMRATTIETRQPITMT